jgi:NADH dehydrogenase FAD-containing subunit
MNRPRLLILGSGFAAFSLLKRMDVRAHDVTVVSPRNHFLFTPLLPSTTVGTVEFRTIIEPVRTCRSKVQFLLGAAEALDTERRVVTCRWPDGGAAWEQPFDLLAVASAASPTPLACPAFASTPCS